jgi:hypothetical protein
MRSLAGLERVAAVFSNITKGVVHAAVMCLVRPATHNNQLPSLD